MEKVILISAKAQHGKNTCADYLKEKLEEQGYKVATISFAKWLKGYLTDYFDWDGVTKDEFYRTQLQYLGTDIIREELKDECFHARRLCRDIEILDGYFDYFIVDDCRFSNECDYTKAMFPRKVVDVRVIRDNFVSPLTVEQQNHRSETDLDDYRFTYVISNSGTLDDFHEEIDRKLGWLYKTR